MSEETEITRRTENFYRLLRMSMGLTQEELIQADVDTWRWLYGTAVRQSLVGTCYQGICLLPLGNMPPIDIAMLWASEAESIRGMNDILNKEAAQLTEDFAKLGRRTVILKGQANARLYPDKYSRQPGDIDIWVEGGHDSVVMLLKEMRLAETIDTTSVEGGATDSYHHIHLPKNEQGVTVEVHFRPSSGNFNSFTNRRLQRWLESEIRTSEKTVEGFNVPSIRFALVMQLAHIQRHFLSGGIGLRQICDYYWLLRGASEDDMGAMRDVMKRFGLSNMAGALMWVLHEVLKLDASLMICAPDRRRGEWMLREIMAGGNFGWYNQEPSKGVWKGFFQSRLRRLKMLPFNSSEVVWMEIIYMRAIIKTLPVRIKYRTFSLRGVRR